MSPFILGIVASAKPLTLPHFISSTSISGVDMVNHSVALDTSYNYYSAGIANGDFPSITKYDKSGTLQWQRTLGTNGGAYRSIGYSPDGSLIFAGKTRNPNTPYGGFNTIGKINSAGTVLWQVRTARQDRDRLDSIVKSDGSIYYQDDANGNNWVKLTTNGVYVSSAVYNLDSTVCIPAGLGTDSTSNLYTWGSRGAYNFFVQKFNSSDALVGTWGWTTDTGSFYARSGTVDKDGNVYVSATSNDGVVSFVAKINSSGTAQWCRRFYSNGWGIYSVAVDSKGNVIAGGYDNSYAKIRIAKWNSAGTLLWQRVLETATEYVGIGSNKSITILPTDDIAIAGYIRRSSATPTAALFVLPKDGSGTGSYAIGGTTVFYSAGSSLEGSTVLTPYTPSVPALSTTYSALTAVDFGVNSLSPSNSVVALP